MSLPDDDLRDEVMYLSGALQEFNQKHGDYLALITCLGEDCPAYLILMNDPTIINIECGTYGWTHVRQTRPTPLDDILVGCCPIHQPGE